MSEIIFERKVAEEILVENACGVLDKGGIVVLPTDTIPGIGCRADDHEAVQRLFELKKRPLTLPIPVVLPDTETIRLYTKNVPESFDALAAKFWPGALTIILRSNGTIDSLVGGGSTTIGFRVPDNRLVRSIVRCLKVPLALTSANPHNVRPSAMHDRLLAWWKNEVELIILGRMTVPRPPSAVINLTTDPPQILREGLIDSNDIMSVALGKQISPA